MEGNDYTVQAARGEFGIYKARSAQWFRRLPPLEFRVQANNGGAMSGEGRLKILLADDQYLFAESLGILIKNNTGDIEVAGIARNGQEAVRMADDLRPDIVVMDIRMSVTDGIDAVRTMKQKQPGIKIVMWSSVYDEELIKSSFLAGASGYLLRDVPPAEFIMALRTVNNSVIQISPEIFCKVIAPDIAPPP